MVKRTVKAFILSAYAVPPWNYGPVWVRQNAKPKSVELVPAPEDAEIILFIENHSPADPYFFLVRRHPIFRSFAEKCVLYHDADLSVTPMRVVSPSIEQWQYDERTNRSFHYLARLCENHAIEACDAFEEERKYLFSFVGSSRRHPVRQRVLKLEHSAALLRDTGRVRAWKLGEQVRRQYEDFFLATTLQSKFVLCPRGVGPATYRLFEAMQLARVPVIISDQWVPIKGIDWNRCAVRVRQRDVERLPEILEGFSDQAVEMGLTARRIWESCFAPCVSLDKLVEAGMELIQERYSWADRSRDSLQFLHPWHARNLARYFRNRLARSKTSRLDSGKKS